MEAALIQCLEASLSPNTETVKQAESHLKQATQAPGFVGVLVNIMSANSNQPRHIKQAAAVQFKNYVKHGWDPEHNDCSLGVAVQENDKATIRQHLVGLMCSANPSVMSQLAEALRIISTYDFPDRWRELLPDLIGRLAAAMQSNNWSVYNGVLETANSIFKRFRYVGKSDALFTQLNYIFKLFCGPMLKHTKYLLQQLPTLAKLPYQQGSGKHPFECCLIGIRTLLRIFYSLNWQDLPEFFEDNINEWMTIFSTLMQPDLKVENCQHLASITSDDEPSPIEKVQSAIIDNLVLYSEKYEEEFQPFMPSFTKNIWTLLTHVQQVPRYDGVVTTALKFFTSTVRKPWNKSLFEQDGFIKAICESVVIPCLRLQVVDEENFEDNPVEYIRNDMEGADGESRRRAACDLVGYSFSFCYHLVKKLVLIFYFHYTKKKYLFSYSIQVSGLCVLFKEEVTLLCGGYINSLLTKYGSNPTEFWKEKDAGLTLFLALGAKGKTRSQGATSVNELVPIDNFFTTQILPELDCNGGKDINSGSSPVLKADAIKFATVFRSVLPAQMVLATMGPLVRLLGSTSRVVHTYAANGIERLLSLKRPGDGSPITEATQTANLPSLFNKQSLQPYLQTILQSLLHLMSQANYSENEYLMRCMVRTITVAEETITPHAATLINELGKRFLLTLLSHLSGIILTPITIPPPNFYFFIRSFCKGKLLARVCANPSNPSFNHLLFESLSALVLYVTKGNPGLQTVENFEASLFGPFTSVLQRDVTEFKPYVFQIFAQLLEMRKGNGVSQAYWGLFQPCLQNNVWTKANTPALARLLTSYLVVDANTIVSQNQLQAVLGCWQKSQSIMTTQDSGFELLTSIIVHLKSENIAPYIRTITTVLVQLMQKRMNVRFATKFLGNFWGVLIAKHGTQSLETSLNGINVSFFFFN
jgi:exportin-2 (importin alpha re-exporter)